jgi:integrase
MKTLEAVATYLSDPANGLKTAESTRSYRTVLTRLERSKPGRSLKRWTEQELVAFCVAPTASGATPADNTIRQRKIVVRAFFSFADWQGWVSKNPGAHLNRAVKHGRQAVRLHNWLPAGDVDKVIAACGHDLIGQRDELIFRLGFTTGLRVSELAALTWDSVDFDAKELHVIGKGRKLATVALSENTHERLCLWHATAVSHIGDPKGPEGVLIKIQNTSDLTKGIEYRVITGLWDQPGLAAHSIAKRVRLVSARAGVPISPHDMRRTYAGLLAQRVSIYDVSKALRHSNVSVTEKYLEGRQDAAVAVSRAAGIDF